MFFTLFSQFFLWFIRNNITVLRYIFIILTHFFFLRDLIQLITNNRLMEWLIPYLRKTHQAQYSFSSPREIIIEPNKFENFLLNYFSQFNNKNSAAYIDTVNLKSNIKIKNEIKKATYYESFVSTDVLTVRNANIDSWEIENMIINTNNFLIFGNDRTQLSIRNLIVQYSINRPYQLYLLPYSLNKNLIYNTAILTELSVGHTYCPIAAYYNSRSIKTLISFQLIPDCIISCADTNDIDIEKKKQILFEILINNIDSMLSISNSFICKAQSTVAANATLNWIKNPDNATTNDGLLWNTVSFMTGTSCANAPLGFIETIYNSLKKQIPTINRYAKFIIFSNLLKWVNLSENKGGYLYKKLQEIMNLIYGNTNLNNEIISEVIEQFELITKKYQIPSKIYISKSSNKINVIDSLVNHLLANPFYFFNQNYIFNNKRQIKSFLSSVIVIHSAKK